MSRARSSFVRVVALALLPVLGLAFELTWTGKPGSAVAVATASDPRWGLAVAGVAVDRDILETGMQHPFTSAGVYVPMTGIRYPFPLVDRTRRDNAQVYLNINSWWVDQSGKKVCYKWADVAAGDYDAYLQYWVDSLRAYNYPNTIITFNHEPTITNNPNQPHCGTAADYVAAFNHVYSYFRSHGITYPFAWVMMASTFTQGTATEYEPAHYQIVGVDGYNNMWDGVWREPGPMFTAADQFAKNRGMPLLVSEIGTAEDPNDPGRKAQWYIDAAQLFRSFGNVMSVEWNDQPDYRPDSSLRSFNGWIQASQSGQDPYVTGTATGSPGGSLRVWAQDFAPGEKVALYLDNASGNPVATPVASSLGSIAPLDVALPPTFAGGSHTLYATGLTSGSVAKYDFTVHPSTPAHFVVSAGDTWNYHGEGFVPGETVRVSFPGGSPSSGDADNKGSVSVSTVVPPEPHGGGLVTISSASDTLSGKFGVLSQVTWPTDGLVPRIPFAVTGTGFGANESVSVNVDGQNYENFQTDASGSFSGQTTIARFGRHGITLHGAASGLTRSHTVTLHPTVWLSQTSGSVGAAITIRSGPGWAPSETVHVKLGTAELDVVTNLRGHFRTTLLVPKHALGTAWLHLTGATNGLTVAAPFEVVSSSS